MLLLSSVPLLPFLSSSGSSLFIFSFCSFFSIFSFFFLLLIQLSFLSILLLHSFIMNPSYCQYYGFQSRSFYRRVNLFVLVLMLLLLVLLLYQLLPKILSPFFLLIRIFLFLIVSQPTSHEQFQAKFANVDTSRLPSGWLDCPNFGQEICCMIPSKVPLCESYNDCVPPGKRYSFKQVIHQQKVLHRKLGLVTDLTNTTRYYQTTDLKKEGIKHVKIPCKGRDSVPDNASVNQFVFEVMQFMTRQKHTKKYILVHCTHGHNRTGYMIIHYLMRTSPISVAQAIKTFADARPPGIYKPDYIDALYSFYHERKPDMVACPSTPDWKRSSEFDLNGEAVPDDDDDGGPAAPLHENQDTNGVLTNDDILGDEIPRDQQEAMRQFCYQCLKLPLGKRGNSQFPGSHPVSLSRDNLQLLRQRYYYATWKADGTRYMMLITMDGCFLIDRNFTFRRVQMRFPCKHTIDGSADKVHHFTLLDGEMVIDTVPDSQKQERRYLIYDVTAINHVSLIEGMTLGCDVTLKLHANWQKFLLCSAIL